MNKSAPLVTECRSPMSPAAFTLRHTSSFRFSFPGILLDELWRRLAANLSRYENVYSDDSAPRTADDTKSFL